MTRGLLHSLGQNIKVRIPKLVAYDHKFINLSLCQLSTGANSVKNNNNLMYFR